MLIEKTFLLDTSILITAKNSYYSFDICQGFWDFIIEQSKNKKIFFIQSVIDEIKDGGDDLKYWLNKNLNNLNIINNAEQDIQKKYQMIANDVCDTSKFPQFSKNEKDRFLSKADPMLIATALYGDYTIVTNEIKVEPNSQKIKIPNICEHYGIDYEITAFTMLKDLDMKLKLERT